MTGFSNSLLQVPPKTTYKVSLVPAMLEISQRKGFTEFTIEQTVRLMEALIDELIADLCDWLIDSGREGARVINHVVSVIYPNETERWHIPEQKAKILKYAERLATVAYGALESADIVGYVKEKIKASPMSLWSSYIDGKSGELHLVDDGDVRIHYWIKEQESKNDLDSTDQDFVY